jgi:hypothetical protein
MSDSIRPLFNVAEVRRALTILVESKSVFEVRALDARLSGERRTGIVSGYFDNVEEYLKQLSRLTSARGIYVTLNPLDPALLARRANRLDYVGKDGTTSDQYVLTRRWLLIDVDADRPSGISATDAEKEAAHVKAREIYQYLKDWSWPEPVVCDSGNGFHLLFRVKLPSADERLIERLLSALANYFDSNGVKIDRAVHNPARIVRLYGTLAAKGDNTKDRPHRLSKIITRRSLVVLTKEESLQNVLADLGAPLTPKVSERQRIADRNGKPDKAEIREMLRFIPKRPHYPDWIKVVAAVFDALPEADAIELLKEWSPEEQEGEYEDKLRHPLENVHIGTLIYVAKQHGYTQRKGEKPSYTTRGSEFARELQEEIKNVQAAQGEKPKLESPEPTQAQPFPLHCLPPVCEAIARAACKTVRVLESLPGCCVLGVQSAAIGAGLQVRSSANRDTRGNLYILSSAESGSGKSETFRHLAKPFFEFEEELVERWRAEMKPGLLAERKVLEAEIAKLTKSVGNADGAFERDEIRAELKKKLTALENVETKLRTPGLSCEDVTGEKLAVLLAHNAEQMASLSADAVAIVNILLGRYNRLDRTDEGIYLKAFTGDRCKVDRQTRESILVESPCLAVLWLTQPDKLESLLAERSLSDGGLIPRLLACHTHCDAQEIVQGAPEIATIVEKNYTDLIRSLIETYRLADAPFTIEPTGEALEAMNAHHNAIVKRRRGDLRDVNIYAARWNEQAWRIAVVLHAAQYGAGAHANKLEIDTAKRAIELADWFATQQLEILSASREKARREIWDEVLSLLAEKPQGVRASDVYRARIVRNADQAHALLDAMEAGGELSGRDEQPESGGHVTRIFTTTKK